MREEWEPGEKREERKEEGREMKGSMVGMGAAQKAMGGGADPKAIEEKQSNTSSLSLTSLFK